MPFPLRTPRVNNNDDTVKLAAVLVEPGTLVRRGDPVCEVQTDKATFTVEAEQDGYLLRILASVGDVVPVGSVLAWMGAAANEELPREESPSVADSSPLPHAEPTLKGALLLRRYGLRAAEIAAPSGRITAEDVERHVRARGLRVKDAETNDTKPVGLPEPTTPADTTPLSPVEAGMVRTVMWHRSEAVPGYVEIAYDPEPWERYAKGFQTNAGLFMSPLLSLMAHQLVGIAQRTPKLNATIHGSNKVLYRQVNLGFTIQSGATLYLAVVTAADRLSRDEFVKRLGELQRLAMKNRLDPSQSSGATIAFTSMARWGATRHQPVLPPQTSFILAHSAAAVAHGVAALGATYDHRLLTGGDAIAVLRELSHPPEDAG